MTQIRSDASSWCQFEAEVVKTDAPGELPRALLRWSGWEGDVHEESFPLEGVSVGDRVQVRVGPAPLDDEDRVKWARFYAAVKHAGKSYGALPYTHHLASTEQVLIRFGCKDVNMRVAAWLHDVVEDTQTKLKEVEEMFGPRVAELVDAVTKGSGPDSEARIMLTYPRIRRVRGAVQLKLADRIANVEAGGALVKKYKRVYEDFRRGLRTARRGRRESRWRACAPFPSPPSRAASPGAAAPGACALPWGAHPRRKRRVLDVVGVALAPLALQLEVFGQPDRHLPGLLVLASHARLVEMITSRTWSPESAGFSHLWRPVVCVYDSIIAVMHKAIVPLAARATVDVMTSWVIGHLADGRPFPLEADCKLGRNLAVAKKYKPPATYREALAECQALGLNKLLRSNSCTALPT